jgi:hypothetical protein
MKPKKSPGRPRKDGSPAQSRYRDPKTNRWAKRPVSGSEPVVSKPPKPASPKGGVGFGIDLSTDYQSVDTVGSAPLGSDAASDAVRQALGGTVPGSAGVDGSGKGSPSVGGVESFVCDWSIVVQTINTILKLTKEEIAMSDGEEKAIGTALDAVIQKHWPDMKAIGPEVALGVALAGYIGRLLLTGHLFNFNRVSSETERAV